MVDFEDERSCRSQKASEHASKVKNDPLLLGQSSCITDGMLGKAAVISSSTIEKEEANE